VTETPTAITDVRYDGQQRFNVFRLDGTEVRRNAESLDGLSSGIYVVNGKKVILY